MYFSCVKSSRTPPCTSLPWFMHFLDNTRIVKIWFSALYVTLLSSWYLMPVSDMIVKHVRGDICIYQYHVSLCTQEFGLEVGAADLALKPSEDGLIDYAQFRTLMSWWAMFRIMFGFNFSQQTYRMMQEVLQKVVWIVCHHDCFNLITFIAW